MNRDTVEPREEPGGFLVAGERGGGGDRARRKREKKGERGETVFFSRVNRGGLLGVHHTRGIYARIKEATLAPA